MISNLVRIVLFWSTVFCFHLITLAIHPELLLHSDRKDYSNTQKINDPQEQQEKNDLLGNDYKQLIDSKNFEFLINRYPCNETSDSENESKKKTVVMVMIHSAPSNTEKRNAIRETWGELTKKSWGNVKMHLLFVFGKVISEDAQDKINEENTKYQDIIQGNFIDAYRNMTYKHVTVLKWFKYFCPKADYLLKTDDDVFVDVPGFVKMLETSEHRGVKLLENNFLLCNVIEHGKPHRSKASKYYVTFKEYPHEDYPPLCIGSVILYSPDAIFKLYREAQISPYFWLDDVYISGILVKRLNMKLINAVDILFHPVDANSFIEVSNGESAKKFVHRYLFGVEIGPKRIRKIAEMYDELRD